MAKKKLTDAQRIDAIIDVLKNNGLSLPAGLDPKVVKPEVEPVFEPEIESEDAN